MQLPGYLAGICTAVGVNQLQVPLAQGFVHTAVLCRVTMARCFTPVSPGISGPIRRRKLGESVFVQASN